MKVKMTQQQLEEAIRPVVMEFLRENINELNEGMFDTNTWQRIGGFAKGPWQAVRGEADKFKRGLTQTGLSNEYGKNDTLKGRLQKGYNYAKKSADTANRIKNLETLATDLWDFSAIYELTPQQSQAVNYVCKLIDSKINSASGTLRSKKSRAYGKPSMTNRPAPQGASADPNASAV